VQSESEIANRSESVDVPGKYCAEDDCNWFKIERSEETAEDTSTASTDESLLARENGRIKLGDENAVSIFHENVTLLGNKAIYIAEGQCPECASDVKIILKRTTTDNPQGGDNTSDQANEAYHPIKEECVNYGTIGNSCSYKHD